MLLRNEEDEFEERVELLEPEEFSWRRLLGLTDWLFRLLSRFELLFDGRAAGCSRRLPFEFVPLLFRSELLFDGRVVDSFGRLPLLLRSLSRLGCVVGRELFCSRLSLGRVFGAEGFRSRS